MDHPLFKMDYQVHSVLSHDGRATLRDHCLRAVEMGLDEIGFTEHKDFDPADPVVDWFDYDRYREAIAAVRGEFKDVLTVRMGVEVDYQRWFEDRISDYLDTHPFDYVIGSVHYAGRAMLMTPEYLEGRDAHAAYRLYFEEVQASVDSGLIDILGHLEYANKRGVKAFGPYSPAPYRHYLERVFASCIEREVTLEINTAGLRQGAGGTYPCAGTVAIYAGMGGRLVSFGSDAHHPDDLAASYEEAAAIALSHGLDSVVTFEGRHRIIRPLVGSTG